MDCHKILWRTILRKIWKHKYKKCWNFQHFFCCYGSVKTIIRLTIVKRLDSFNLIGIKSFLYIKNDQGTHFFNRQMWRSENGTSFCVISNRAVFFDDKNKNLEKGSQIQFEYPGDDEIFEEGEKHRRAGRPKKKKIYFGIIVQKSGESMRSLNCSPNLQFCNFLVYK